MATNTAAATEENRPKYPELHDIPQVTLQEAKEQIMLSIECNQRRGTIVLVSESGVGKTQVCAQIAQETNRRLMPIHTAQWSLLGAGIPLRTADDFFKIAVPDIFPKPEEDALILFDELNRGPKHTINMFFTLMEDGRIFNYLMPHNCIIVGTMNPATAQYAVTVLETEAAFRRRIKFMYVVPDVKGFLKHASSPRFHASSFCENAKDKPCHPNLLSYFKAKPSNIYDVKAKDQNKQYCCPAVIETVSEDLYNMEYKHISIHDTYALNRIGASLGTTMALEIIAHLKDSAVTLSADDVLNNFPKVKRSVTALIRKNMHEKLVDLSINVVNLMFATTPPVETTAVNFLDFCTELPKEIAHSVLTSLAETARQNKAVPYLNSLMGELQNYDHWADLQIAMDANHLAVEKGIQKAKE